MRACRKLLLKWDLLVGQAKLKCKKKKNTDWLKFQDFNICPNILNVDADADRTRTLTPELFYTKVQAR